MTSNDEGTDTETDADRTDPGQNGMDTAEEHETLERLHQLSAVVRTLKSGTALGIGAAYLFLGGGGLVSLMLFPILAVSYVAAYTYEHLYVKRFRYGLVEDELVITSGVISRRDRRIPLHRVQNIDIRRPFVLSWFGVNELHIETAGGGETEVSLRYVSYETAVRFQDRIREEKEEAAETDASDDELPADQPATERRTAEPVRTTEMNVSNLFVYSVFALTRGRTTLIYAVATGLVGVLLFAPVLFELVPPLMVASGFVFAGLLWVQEAVRRYTRYHDCIMEEYEDRIRIEHGMFTRHERTLPREKIQSVTVVDDPVTRMLGLAGLQINTAGYAPGEESKEYHALPMADRDEVITTMNRVMPGEVVDWKRPPKRARRRYVIRFLLAATAFLAVLAAVPYLVDVPLQVPPALIPLLLVVAVVGAHYRWKHRGYAVTEESMSARNGFWHRDAAVVVYRRVQDVIQTETILQRRWNLATLTLDTAGSYGVSRGNPTIMDIDKETADRLRKKVREEIRGEQMAMPEPLDETGEESTENDR